ncbi:MAG TPA: hypothetical protein VEK56_10975 [Vicinamibacterales bacterium]|nr:hypothetical protein [Vicinamibacterales bacterium]
MTGRLIFWIALALAIGGTLVVSAWRGVRRRSGRDLGMLSDEWLAEHKSQRTDQYP